MRIDQRQNSDLRPLSIETGVNRYAEGSALIKIGHTHVLCTASVEINIPKWLQGQGKGWVTAEYGMLPRSTHERMNREKAASSGRTQEISRLVARSLRSSVDLYKIGEKQINIDCDVLQADGGTRTAAITGGFVALVQALAYLKKKDPQMQAPIRSLVSAISVGMIAGEPTLDLCYQEDSTADTDANFVMNSAGEFVEIQGTAEEKPFTQAQLQAMIDLAGKGCQELFAEQKRVLTAFNIESLLESK
jgi:ribonuclease PH